jgi:uncharacterized protein YggE
MMFPYKTSLYGRLIPSVALSLTTLILLPTPRAAAQDADRSALGAGAGRRLTVTGQGEVKVQPDTAIITIGVTTQAKSSQEAARANADAAQRVQDAIKGAGVAEKDMQTANYSIQPVYSHGNVGFGGGGFGGGGTFIDQQGNVVSGDAANNNNQAPNRPIAPQGPTIIGYQVSNQVRVTVHDITRISNVIDATTKNNANTIEGITFTREDQETFENQALEKAIADARRKADHLAKAAGVNIIGVYEINEGGTSRPFPMMMSARLDKATPIQPGEVNVSASVTVVYQIGGGGGARLHVGKRAKVSRQRPQP